MSDLKLDMMAEARNAQWSVDMFLGHGAIKVIAPAKVNLFLGVGQRDATGYHKVVNVLHALGLHDTLYMNCQDSQGGCAWKATADQRTTNAESFSLSSSSAPTSTTTSMLSDELPAHIAIGGPEENILVNIYVADKSAGKDLRTFPVPAKENLVFKAIDLLARETEHTHPEEVLIHIDKQIPQQAGLGGGSSDAAAALLGCAHFWGLPQDDPAILRVARTVGIDVPFFLHGGCAVFTGFGDEFARALTPAKLSIVLVKPSVGVSTIKAYQTFDESPQPINSDLLTKVENASSAEQVPLFNNLAPAAETLAPELAEIREWLAAQLAQLTQLTQLTQSEQLAQPTQSEQPAQSEQLAERVANGMITPSAAANQLLLCGSGACTFAITPDFSCACKIATAAQAKGWWARATTLSRLKATILPKDAK